MKEKNLLKIAVICALIGIFTLFIFSEQIEIKEKTIEKITSENVDETIKVKGIVTRVTNMEKVAFLEVSQPQEITIVLFKDSNITLEQGSYVEIEGSVEEYEGKLEVIGNKIKVLR